MLNVINFYSLLTLVLFILLFLIILVFFVFVKDIDMKMALIYNIELMDNKFFLFIIDFTQMKFYEKNDVT